MQVAALFLRILAVDLGDLSEPGDIVVWAGIALGVLVAIGALAKTFLFRDPFYQRRRAIEALSFRLGLSFETEGMTRVSRIIDSTETLSSVNFQVAYNCIYGHLEGWRVVAFDLASLGQLPGADWYKVEADRRTAEHLKEYISLPWSAAALLGTIDLPRVVVKPRSIVGRAIDAIECESPTPLERLLPDFNIGCEDPQAFEEALPPAATEVLKTLGKHTLEIAATGLVVSSGSEWDPEEFTAALEFLGRFADALPDELLKRSQE